MPVTKCGKKYRIGSGPCMYKSKASAERAYAAYRAKAHSENLEEAVQPKIKSDDLSLFWAIVDSGDRTEEFYNSKEGDSEWEFRKEEDGLSFESAEEESLARKEWARDEAEFNMDSGYPSHYFSDLKMVPVGSWLIHFTDSDPLDIVERGFLGRSPDIVGLTVGWKKNAQPGDLALAFMANRVSVGRGLGFGKYGENAVIFKAEEAVSAWHNGDEEQQVVFDVSGTSNMWPIEGRDSQLILRDKSGRIKMVADRNQEGVDAIISAINSNKFPPLPEEFEESVKPKNPTLLRRPVEIPYAESVDQWGVPLTESAQQNEEKIRANANQVKWAKTGVEGIAFYDIPIDEFLKLTTRSDLDIDRIKASTKDVEHYNSPSAQADMMVHPHLTIDENGQVVGHEGRHRASAEQKTGEKTFRVVLVASQSGWPVETHGWRWKRRLNLPAELVGQFRSVKHKIIPSNIEMIEPMYPEESLKEAAEAQEIPFSVVEFFKAWDEYEWTHVEKVLANKKEIKDWMRQFEKHDGVTVYRGVHIHPEMLDQWVDKGFKTKKGEKFSYSDKRHTSWSTDPETAKQFVFFGEDGETGIVLKTRLKKGQQLVNIGALPDKIVDALDSRGANVARMVEEREIVALPGSFDVEVYYACADTDVSGKCNDQVAAVTEGARGDWEKEGYELHYHNDGRGRIFIRASHPADREVGYAKIYDNSDSLAASEIAIHPDHRRKGLATAMYRLAEKETGKKIVRGMQYPDGKALWSQPNRPFGESALNETTGRKDVESYSETLYHGSPTKVTSFDVSKGSGQFGTGIYLTPDRDIAAFHARGGRQGRSGQRLSDKPGFTYEVKVLGRAAVITDEDAFFRDLVSEWEPAGQAFAQTGSVDSKMVTRTAADWARDQGYDLLVFAPKESGVLTPFDQVLVLNQDAVKGVSIQDSAVAESDCGHSDAWGIPLFENKDPILQDIKAGLCPLYFRKHPRERLHDMVWRMFGCPDIDSLDAAQLEVLRAHLLRGLNRKE